MSTFGVGHHDGTTFAATPVRDLPLEPTSIDGPDVSARFIGGLGGVLHYVP